MAKRGAFIRSRIGDFAAIALCGLRPVLGTRCIVVRNVVRKAVAERVNDLFLAAQFFAADGAVNDLIIRAGRGTACRHFVLANDFAFGMTFCGDLYIRRVVAAGTGVIRFPADLGTRCRFCFVMLEIVTEGFAVLSAANFAFCGVGASCLAAAVVCLIVDLIAAAAFVPMRGTVRCPLFGPIMAKRGAFIRSRIGDFAAIALCGLRPVLGTRCIVVRDIARKAMAERVNDFLLAAQFFTANGAVNDLIIRAGRSATCRYFVLANSLIFDVLKCGDRFRRSRNIFLAAKHDLSGVGPQPFRFAFRRRRYDVRDRAAGCCYSLLVTAILTGASKRCRCRRVPFPRPFGLTILMAKRLTILKDLFSGFAADRAALVVSCFHGTRCRRDEILFVRVLHIDVLRKIAVLSAADLALCKSNARRDAADVVCLVVNLVAAATFVPMRGTVRRPLFGPIMAKRGAFIRSRIGDFAAIALCGLRPVLGTRCIVVRNVARKAMAERVDDLSLAAQFFTADGAVDDLIIRAGRGAACRHFVFTNSLTFGMAKRVNFYIRRVVTAATGIVGIPADLGTRCRFCFVMLEVMTERVNDLFLAAQFFAADGAVNDLVIRAGRGAACRHFVFANSFTLGMAKRVTVCSAANFAFCGVCTRCLAAAMVCLVVDLVAAAAFVPMRGTVRRPLFGPIMAERFDLFIRRIIAAGTGIVGIPTDFGTRCRLCFVMLEVVPESFERFRRSRDVFLAAEHDLSGVGPQPFRFAFRGRRYDTRDRTPGCCCSLLVAAAAGASKRCRCRRITFPRPFWLAVRMAERIAVLKDLIPGFAADGATLVVGCLCGTCCSRDKILFLRIFYIDVLCKFAVFSAADLALCKRNARRVATAVVCLVVDLFAAAAFVPMRGTVRRPLFGPIMAERFDLFIRRIIAAGTGIVGIPTDFGTRCRLCFVMLEVVPESFERFRRSRDVFLAAEHDLSGVGPQPFRFAFRGRRYDTRDRTPGCCCSLLVAAAAGASKRCRCRRITFPRPFWLAVRMAERIAVLKDLIPGFAADGATLVVGCLCGTCCSRDKILFLRIFYIDVLCKFAVFSAADLALCKRNARRVATAVVCLVVDLFAAAAFVPMRSAVRRPLFGPLMAKRRAFVRPRVGDFAAVAFCGLRSVLGTRCIVVRNIARKAMAERFDLYIRRVIAVFARLVWLPASLRAGRILPEMRYRFVTERFN